MDKKTCSLYRIDKHTGKIEEFRNGNNAIEQFRMDFRVSKPYAIKSLFEVLTDPEVYFSQNMDIAWTNSRELAEA